MKLWEALRLLEEGNKIKRSCWSENDYIYKNKETNEYERSVGHGFIYNLPELNCGDWEIYDEREELPERFGRVLKELYKINESPCENEDCGDCPFNMDIKLSGVRGTSTACDVLADLLYEMNEKYKLDK